MFTTKIGLHKLFAVLFLTAEVYYARNIPKEFDSFILKYGKNYTLASEDYYYRLRIFYVSLHVAVNFSER